MNSTNSVPENESDPVATIFKKRLESLGYGFELQEDGRYKVDWGQDFESLVYLGNKRKEFESDPDPEIIHRFIDQVKRTKDLQIPTWEEVQPFLRYQLDASDYVDLTEDDGFFDHISDELMKIYVYVSPDGGLISWINKHHIKEWQTDIETIQTIAEKNMDVLVTQTTLELTEIAEGVEVGMLATYEGGFKASLLLSPKLKELVEDQLGFPVYAVAPDRDFVFLLSKQHTDSLGLLGPVVLREYEKSSYSISNEVFEIGENGLKAIGSFSSKPKES